MIVTTVGSVPFSIDHPLALPILIFTFFLGASLGSFTNVLIYRIPLDMSVVTPGSACPRCRHELRWYENIPIVSYLFLRGRCSGCGVSISAQYPFIELLGGLGAVSLSVTYLWPLWSSPELWVEAPQALIAPALEWLWLSLFICLMIAISVIDLRYTFIPDELSLSGIWIALCAGFFIPHPTHEIIPAALAPLDHLIGAAAGYGVIIMVRWIGFLIYRREAMGLGDAKLLALIGATLGYRALALIMFGAATQGLIAAALALAYTKMTRKPNLLTLTSDELDERFGEEGLYDQERVMLAIPFGPFLCLAAVEILLIGEVNVWRWLSP